MCCGCGLPRLRGIRCGRWLWEWHNREVAKGSREARLSRPWLPLVEFDNGCWSKLNTGRLRHWWVLLVPDTEVLIQIVNTSHVGIHMELWRSVLPSLPARCILDVNGMTQQNADSWVHWMLPLVSSSHVAQGCWIDHRVSFRATKLVCFLVKSVEGGVSFVDPVSGHPRLLYGNHEEPPWPKCIQVFAHAIFIKVQ